MNILDLDLQILDDLSDQFLGEGISGWILWLRKK
jgi:hypothetical protein